MRIARESKSAYHRWGGFIGSHLADELLAAGYQVRVLDNLLARLHGDVGLVRANNRYVPRDAALRANGGGVITD